MVKKVKARKTRKQKGGVFGSVWFGKEEMSNLMYIISKQHNTISDFDERETAVNKSVKEWLEKNQVKFDNPQNSEEIALSRVGKKLYEKLFLPYTLKQWNKNPKELDSSVLSRSPVKYNNDTRYFTDKYQVIPEKGYTSFFESLLIKITFQILYYYYL